MKFSTVRLFNWFLTASATVGTILVGVAILAALTDITYAMV